MHGIVIDETDIFGKRGMKKDRGSNREVQCCREYCHVGYV